MLIKPVIYSFVSKKLLIGILHVRVFDKIHTVH